MTISYTHRGVRNLTILHERSLREFLDVWCRFKESRCSLPDVSDENYRTPERLLCHVLRCARHYMVWMCEKLELPDPGIRAVPEADAIEAESTEYMEHLLERWRHPLVDLSEKTADRSVFESGWGVDYCIDAMLEHAVMHPVRHTFQLQELMSDR